MVLPTGSRRYNGSASSQNSSTDVCIRTSTHYRMITECTARPVNYGRANVRDLRFFIGVSAAGTHCRRERSQARFDRRG